MYRKTQSLHTTHYENAYCEKYVDLKLLFFLSRQVTFINGSVEPYY